jgi:PAS domain S-box-containing protein
MIMGLDPEQGKILATLNSLPKACTSQGDLATKIRLRGDRVAGLLRDLRHRGLVHTYTTSRYTRVEITPAGRSILTSARTVPPSAADMLVKPYLLEKLISQFSTEMASGDPEPLGAIIEHGLQRALKLLGADRVCWYMKHKNSTMMERIYSVHRSGTQESPSSVNVEQIPYAFQYLEQGGSLVLQGPDDLPAEAKCDREFFRKSAIDTLVLIPSSCGTNTLGILGVAAQPKRAGRIGEYLGQLSTLNNLIVTAVERQIVRKWLAESEQRFRALFHAAPVGIALEDSGGSLLFVNPSFCNMLGYSAEELRGKRCTQLSHPEDVKIESLLFKKLMAGEIPSYVIEKRFLRKDGREVWSRVHISLQKSDGASPLVIGMTEDISAQKATTEELHQAEAELQQLAHRLIQVQDEERRRISRELHDDLGQRLSLFAIELDLLKNSLAALGHHREEKQVSDLHLQADELTRDVHELSHELHSGKLQHVGLRAALHDLCNHVSVRHHVNMDFGENSFRLPPEVELCLFRVAQEALNNVIKHSNAKDVAVKLSMAGEKVQLQIKDNGTGFDPAGSFSGIGIVSMRERLRMIGGSLGLQSSSGGGTAVTAEVSVPAHVLSSGTAA